MALLESFEKYTQEKLDYSIDFTNYLAGLSDTISSYTVTVDQGIDLVSDSQAGGVVTVWLDNGVVGTRYKVVATITTTAGREKSGCIEVVVVKC